MPVGLTVGAGLQLVPFQCRSAPSSAPAHTSVALVPHTDAIVAVVPLAIVLHAVPFQRTIVPSSPTAQASVVVRAHTPRSRAVVLLVTLCHTEPLHVAIR